MARRPVNMGLGTAMAQAGGWGGGNNANANVGQPAHVSRKKSDIRFRSFAERWLVGRAHLITADPNKVAEHTYQMILDAKRAYAMIRTVGETIETDVEVE